MALFSKNLIQAGDKMFESLDELKAYVQRTETQLFEVKKENEIFRHRLFALENRDATGLAIAERLTLRERRVIFWIVQASNNREIAEKFHTSEQVVKNWMRAVYDKTGTNDRLSLAMLAVRHPALLRSALNAAKSCRGVEIEVPPLDTPVRLELGSGEKRVAKC